MQKTHKIGGFTIIEVVLVLAIAGLIFLLVFLAFPALQRSNQDTQRRNDIGRLVSQVANYQSNNQGQLPSASDFSGGDFIDDYMTVGNEVFADPVHGDYALVNGASTPDPSDNQIAFRLGYVCDGEDFTNTGAGPRNVAFRIDLAGGGYYCQSN